MLASSLASSWFLALVDLGRSLGVVEYLAKVLYQKAIKKFKLETGAPRPPSE